MNQTPRAKMKQLGLALAIVATLAIIGDIYLISAYLHLSSFRWDVIFRTEPLHHHFMMMLAAFVFVLLPSVAGLCGFSAWMIFKNLNHISDESHAA